MEGITIGQIAHFLEFIAGIFIASGVIVPVVMKNAKAVIQKNVKIGLEPVYKEIDKINENSKKCSHMHSKGLQCLLRNDILYIYQRTKDNKEITMQEKQSINYSYEIYKSIGGNSFVQDIVEEMNTYRVID